MSKVNCADLPASPPLDTVPGSAERAYLLLEERIATLALPPGWTSPIKDLCAELAIETAALCKALERLACAGLVDIIGESIVVCDVDTTRQLQALEMRRGVETLAARLAAERATQAQRDRFRAFDATFRRVRDHGDAMVFLRLDSVFNRLLGEAAQNPYCLPMIVTMEGQARRYFYAHREALDLGATADLHADIARAIARGDARGSERCVHRLLDYNETHAAGQIAVSA